MANELVNELEKEGEVLKGWEIESIHTISGTYAEGQLNVFDNEGNQFRLHVEHVLEAIKDWVFVVKKKRKFKHVIMMERYYDPDDI